MSVPLEWTSLRDQGPVTKVLEEVDYHWSYREAEARMDWSRTPIGYVRPPLPCPNRAPRLTLLSFFPLFTQPKQWHPTLRTMMNCIETMPDLGAIWWFLPDQDDWFMLHNSVYETALRNPTGAHFGRYASDSWGGENWETLKARAHECQNSGQGCVVYLLSLLDGCELTSFARSFLQYLHRRRRLLPQLDRNLHELAVESHHRTQGREACVPLSASSVVLNQN